MDPSEEFSLYFMRRSSANESSQKSTEHTEIFADGLTAVEPVVVAVDVSSSLLTVDVTVDNPEVVVVIGTSVVMEAATVVTTCL